MLTDKSTLRSVLAKALPKAELGERASLKVLAMRSTPWADGQRTYSVGASEEPASLTGAWKIAVRELPKLA